MKFLKWFGFALGILAIIVGVLLAVNVFLPEGWTLSSEILLGLSAIVLSLVFTYWPGIRVKFARLSSSQKSLVNLIAVTVLAIIMFLGSCIKLFEIHGLTCSTAGVRTLAIYVVVAIGGNQLAYTASVQPADVVEAKTFRDGAG